MRTESLRDLLSEFPDIDGFWDFEDLIKTEDTIKQHILRGSSVDILIQLARVQGLLGKLQDCSATLIMAKDLLIAQNLEGSRSEIRFFLEQGRFHSLSMSPPQSLTYFSKAWELAQRLDEIFFSIEAALMLSIIQPPKYQNQWLKQGLQIAEGATEGPDSVKGRLWLSHLYLKAGWNEFDFRRFEEALDYFKKALESPQDPKQFKMGFRARWSIGRTLRALNRTEEALIIQRELLSNLNFSGQGSGHIYLEIAECLQVLQKHDEAKVNFESAYNELSLNSWYSDNKAFELSRIQHLYKKK